jgi:uncharacterized protein (DUF58 family)
VSDRANEILIKSKRKNFSANLGENETTFVGNGLDFSELREYHFGDDVRKINWKATAKEQKPYINLFNEQRELNIIIAYMISGNISFGSKRLKQDLMSEILALLGYGAMKNSDRVTSIFFSNKEEYFHKPTKSINSLNEIVPKSLEFDVMQKEVDYSLFCEYLLNRVKQKSIIFIIGDFYEDIDLSLIASKHEVYTIIVRDRFEEDPKLLGEFELLDPISLDKESIEFDKNVLNEYKESIKAIDEKLSNHLKANMVRFTKIYTDEDPFLKLNYLVR